MSQDHQPHHSHRQTLWPLATYSTTLLAWYIQPGKPQQNAYVERYNRTVPYDWLGQYLFENLEEVQDFATKWQWSYNHERPNMALGGITPMQKVA